MEFYTHPSHPLPSSSSAASLLSFGYLVDRIKECFGFAVSAIWGNVFSAIFTFFFAIVGTLLGAMTGALIGQETENESGIGCLLYLIDVIVSLLSSRLVRERIGPAMLSAMGAVETTTFEEIPNIFDTGGAKGLAGDTVEKIPKIAISKDENVDASGRESLVQSAFRASRLGKLYGVCLSATTCFTYLALIPGC
ncbi:NEP1-interacting protein 1 [Abeliophyllum distichum]|uniref:NEP1-interacting protein 1 n=1 Tax=Abeliophyllum distichum TaxID=126358 RepID=A0ABD1V2P1_9LAMI